MSIESVSLTSFRNFEEVSSLLLGPDVNFIIGDNGSGKSSFLEALFVISHGKSFRTGKLDKLVKMDDKSFVVAIKDSKDNRYGFGKSLTGPIIAKVNGESCKKLSELASNFVVQVMTPETFKIFVGGPNERRKFVNLGLFHVKHSYGELFQRFSRVLKQRNAILKTVNALSSELEYWTIEFIELSEKLNAYRQDYVVALKSSLDKWLNCFMPEVIDEFSIELFNGWSSNSKVSLSEAIEKNQQREISFGFSQVGAQKFDLVCKYKNKPVEEVFSRGQQKLMLIALVFAQADLVSKSANIKPIILIDDIGAELDTHAKMRFANAINQIDAQMIITAINEIAIAELKNINKNYKMFHVKHGVIESK